MLYPTFPSAVVGRGRQCWEVGVCQGLLPLRAQEGIWKPANENISLIILETLILTKKGFTRLKPVFRNCCLLITILGSLYISLSIPLPQIYPFSNPHLRIYIY